MKTAISLPDALFSQLALRAKALKISRSALLARAAREYLDALPPISDATEEWNRAIERAGQPGDDRVASAAQKKSKAVIRRRAGRKGKPRW